MGDKSELGAAELKAASAAAYAAAADHFDAPALSFWDLYGGRTVVRADLPRGARGARCLLRHGRIGAAGR